MAAFDRRTLGIGVAVWLLVVVVVSAATWTVIDAAGSDVTARPSSDPAAATDDTASELPAPGTVTPRPTRRPKPTRTATPRTTAPTATASPEATGTTSPTTPATNATPSSRPSPTRSSSPKPPPAPTPHERTWTGRAGTVTVRCIGARISLLSATPANGWRQEVDERGPDRVRVRYREADARSGSEEDETEGGDDQVDVRAQCGGGTPRFSVDS